MHFNGKRRCQAIAYFDWSKSEKQILGLALSALVPPPSTKLYPRQIANNISQIQVCQMLKFDFQSVVAFTSRLEKNACFAISNGLTIEQRIL